MLRGRVGRINQSLRVSVIGCPTFLRANASVGRLGSVEGYVVISRLIVMELFISMEAMSQPLGSIADPATSLSLQA